MDGITFDATEFIGSPFFWRAMLVLVTLYLLKNVRPIFDGLKYAIDRIVEIWKLRAQSKGQVDQAFAAILREKTSNGSKFDASFAITLQQSIITEKDAEIDDLKSRLELANRRNNSLTALAIEKSEESTRVISLLNGTVAVFNTVAEKLSVAIENLVIVLANRGASDQQD